MVFLLVRNFKSFDIKLLLTYQFISKCYSLCNNLIRVYYYDV